MAKARERVWFVPGIGLGIIGLRGVRTGRRVIYRDYNGKCYSICLWCLNAEELMHRDKGF